MSKITLFTSGGREYAACPTPEGANCFYVYGKKLLCYYVKVEGVAQHVEMSQSLPDGVWTILGRLNELPMDQYHIELSDEFYEASAAKYKADNIEPDPNPLILFKQ